MPELLFNEKSNGRSFSITIPLRNGIGDLTGKTKTFETDDAAELAEWYERNTFKKPKKQKPTGMRKQDSEKDKPSRRSRRKKKLQAQASSKQ